MLELFNLQSDPYERVNLAGDPANSEQLRQLQAWVRQLALEMVSTLAAGDPAYSKQLRQLQAWAVGTTACIEMLITLVAGDPAYNEQLQSWARQVALEMVSMVAAGDPAHSEQHASTEDKAQD